MNITLEQNGIVRRKKPTLRIAIIYILLIPLNHFGDKSSRQFITVSVDNTCTRRQYERDSQQFQWKNIFRNVTGGNVDSRPKPYSTILLKIISQQIVHTLTSRNDCAHNFFQPACRVRQTGHYRFSLKFQASKQKRKNKLLRIVSFKVNDQIEIFAEK